METNFAFEITEEQLAKIPPRPREEQARFVLRATINYRKNRYREWGERPPAPDWWDAGLQFALSCVMEKLGLVEAVRLNGDQAELAKKILGGLICYHERMTMFRYPAGEYWKGGLQIALDCVKEKMEEGNQKEEG